jgi:hypothetical protein
MQTASRYASSSALLAGSLTGRSIPLLMALGLAGLAAIPPERLRSGPILCPIRRITGFPCPACGMTRSWNAALRLDIAGSIRHHPAGIAALLLMVVAASSDLTLTKALEATPRRIRLLGALAWISWWAGRLRAVRS